MLHIHTVEHASELFRLRSLWEDLSAGQQGTVFQSFAWNETAARVFEAREPLRVIVIENDAGAAIVPACVSRKGVALIGETLFDYRDVLCSDASLISVVWEKLSETGHDFDLTALRAESVFSRWSALSPAPFASAPAVLRAGVTSEEFLHRHNRLGRHSRRVRKHGIELHRYTGSAQELIRTIYENKGRQGTADSNLFSDPVRREFMYKICGHPEVDCDVFTYETTGELVAALVTFRDGSWRRFYTVYYDQRWASLSPGQVLLFEVTAESLSEGLNCDFMTGEYPYKMRLATDTVPLFRVRATAQQLREASVNAPATLAA